MNISSLLASMVLGSSCINVSPVGEQAYLPYHNYKPWAKIYGRNRGRQNCQPNNSDSLDSSLRSLITQQGLKGDPASGRDIPDISSDKAQLGMRLFFNKALGGEKNVACVSCHHPLLGGGDDLSLPIGVGAVQPDLLGPGREHLAGKPNVPRNSPTTFNIALWDSAIFWDGRIESQSGIAGANGAIGGIRTPSTALGVTDVNAGTNLASAQAKFPVTSHEEMRGEFAPEGDNTYVWDHLSGRLGNFGEGAGELLVPEYWVGLFQMVYGDINSSAEAVITPEHVFDALGAYERSQIFVDNPWSQYVKGDTQAIDESAKRGALLFYRPYAQGGANCVACHAGDTFTDEQFYTLAAPQLGKGGRGGEDNSNDFGRGNETRLETDRFSFRTPSLLNVEGMAPYTHAGAYLDLEAVVRHHLDPEQAVAHYDAATVMALNPGIQVDKVQSNTREALDKLRDDQLNRRTPLQTAYLNETNVNDLVAFLKTLTDPCIKSASCLAKWMPPLAEDPNGLQLDARFDLSARQAKVGH